ncbi:MAG: hypothetical protein HDR56_01685 [Treponema sp.]|nr:hypothetical protein [Treponema sp.]
MDGFTGSLFDFPTESKKEERIRLARENAPDNIALVYTATAHGKASCGHFFMKIEDAKKFCSSPKSKGVLLGNEWAFFWTSLKNYLGNFLDLTEHGIDFSKFCENGSKDDLLRKLDIRPLSPVQVFEDLRIRGFNVIWPPLSNLYKCNEVDRTPRKKNEKLQ